ncbi:GGDEF domain-containing protein [Maricaulis sp. W15]|uniref:GGDEF domain-containing protein n=1 Tax=Maricaulis sp. W15 TaxID=1772333 RepID=UPI0009FA89B1|nr:GGDEF domain-containing protein [Maricaulis sp. W15]
MLRRYWPADCTDQHMDIASRRSLSAFCVLPGIVGVTVTLVSLKFLEEEPGLLATGAIASLICLVAPIWINAAHDYKNRARLLGALLLLMLAGMAVMGKALISPANIMMLPGIMTFTLAVGWRTGLAYMLAALAIYLGCVVQSPEPLGYSVTSSNVTLLTALGGAAIFIFIGAMIFRHEMVNAAMRLEAAKKAAEISMAHFRERAATDALTGAANRAAIDQILAAEIDRSRDAGRPFAVVVFDLDHFKRVNDTFGHLAGDRVLIETVRVVKQVLRTSDTLGRIGGEEFAVILPGVSGQQAHVMAERMRKMIAEISIDVEGRGSVSPTASFGVAESDVNACGADLLERADECLYSAKRGGRNRVESGPRPSGTTVSASRVG